MNKYRELAKLARRAAAKLRARESCKQKRRYDSRDDAICVGFRVYRCPSCSGWHRASLSVYKALGRLKLPHKR